MSATVIPAISVETRSGRFPVSTEVTISASRASASLAPALLSSPLTVSQMLIRLPVTGSQPAKTVIRHAPER